MGAIRFEVLVEPLRELPDPFLCATFDGIPYRLELLGGDARRYRARLLEPWRQDLEAELPLFVLGLTPFRFVRDGRPTEELWRILRQRLASLHEGARRDVDLEAALAVDPARLEARAESLARQALPMARDLDRGLSRARRELQRRVRDRELTQAESLERLAALDREPPPGLRELREALRPLRAEETRLREEAEGVPAAFEAATGLSLRAVLTRLDGSPCGRRGEGR